METDRFNLKYKAFRRRYCLLLCSAQQQEFHNDNLETALGIIAQVGSLYDRLEVSAQKELLLHMVRQVVVNTDGEIVLELNAPFAYLKDLSDRVKRSSETPAKMQTSDASDDIGCSDCVQRVSTNWTKLEQFTGEKIAQFFQVITFPQRELCARYSTVNSN